MLPVECQFFYYFDGLCHKNIADLGQFCAEVITKCLYLAQNALRLLKKISKKFHQRALTIIIFFFTFFKV